MKETVQKNADGSAVHTMELDGQTMSINISASQLQQLVMAAIQAAKEPDADTKERLAAEKANREASMKSMIKFAQEEEASRKMAQDICSHKKQDGSTRIHLGQVYSNGKIQPICVWCQKLFKPYDAPRELMGGQGIG